MWEDRQFRRLVKGVLLLTLLLLLKQVPYLTEPILQLLGLVITPAILALFFYYALRPLTRFFKSKMPAGLAVGVSFLLVLAVLTLATVTGGSVVSDQFKSTFIDNAQRFSDLRTTLEEPFQALPLDFSVDEAWVDGFRKGVTTLSSNLFGIFSSLSDFGTQLVLSLFFLFYLLKEDETFKNYLYEHAVPKSHQKPVKRVAARLDERLSTYIGGQLLVALVIGTLMYIAYMIIGMPSALLMAFFSMITAIIPFLGPILGVLPALLIAMTESLALVVKVIVAAVIVQQLEGNLITPKIMGAKLSLHPLVIIVVVIASLSLWGILGAFVGIPAFLIVKTLITDYREHKKEWYDR